MKFISIRTIFPAMGTGVILSGMVWWGLVCSVGLGQGTDPSARHLPEATDAYSAAFFIASDLNRDKILTRREMRIFQDLLFGKADADGDGSLSHGEVMAFLAQEAEKQGPRAVPKAPRPEIRSLPHERDRGLADGFERTLVRLDLNNDGLLQRSEVPAGMDSLFEHYDADGNGALDVNELKRAREVNKKWKNRRDFQDALARFDTNRDGAIDRSEAKGKWAKRFDEFDRNGDGFLDERDMPERVKQPEPKPRPDSRPADETDTEPEMMM